MDQWKAYATALERIERLHQEARIAALVGSTPRARTARLLISLARRLDPTLPPQAVPRAPRTAA